MGEVQAIVHSGLQSLRFARYWLLRIADATKARAWLRRPDVLQRVLCAEQASEDAAARGKAGWAADVPNAPNAARAAKGARVAEVPHATEALALAFTYAGLCKLGWRESAEFPFPSAFREGMNEPRRAAALGDADADSWDWGDLPGGHRAEVHVLLAHFAKAQLDEGGPAGWPELQQSGFDLVRTVRTCAAHLRWSDELKEGRMYEPFGFRDGIAQPRLRHWSPELPSEAIEADDDVAEGEFVLGRLNEYGDLSYAPDAVGWDAAGSPAAAPRPRRFGSFGSYLVVRQIRQDVAEFRKVEASAPKVNGDRPSLVEKMMGRRKDGRPLLPAAASRPLNGFRYQELDTEGFACPLGAHIRRANPRDMFGATSREGVANAKLHRLLRRARVFCRGCASPEVCADTPLDAPATSGCGEGLFFLAVNADLDRQFEFVQQHWIMNAGFANLASEVDPIIGGGAHRFTVPGPAIGQHCPKMSRFTTLEGGGYFFLPSLSALRFLAQEPAATVSAAPGAATAASLAA